MSMATAAPVASPLSPAAFVGECVAQGIVLSVNATGKEPTITAKFSPGVGVPLTFAPYLKQNKAAILLYLQTGKGAEPEPQEARPMRESTRPVQPPEPLPAPVAPITQEVPTEATPEEKYPDDEYEYRDTRRMVGELCIALRKNAIPMPGDGIPPLLLGESHPSVVTDPPHWVQFAIESAIRLKQQLAECDADLEAARRAGYSDSKTVRIRERVVEELDRLNRETIQVAQWYENLPTEIVLPLIMASWNGGRGPLPIEERLTIT